MKSNLRSVRLARTEPQEKPRIGSISRVERKGFLFEDIHKHTLDSFRERMKAYQEAYGRTK